MSTPKPAPAVPKLREEREAAESLRAEERAALRGQLVAAIPILVGRLLVEAQLGEVSPQQALLPAEAKVVLVRALSSWVVQAVAAQLDLMVLIQTSIPEVLAVEVAVEEPLAVMLEATAASMGLVAVAVALARTVVPRALEVMVPRVSSSSQPGNCLPSLGIFGS